MSFEARTLHSDSDKITIGVLVEGNTFHSFGVTYRPLDFEDYWDGEEWIKYTFFPALDNWINHRPNPNDEGTLAEINYEDRLEMWGLLQKAEALGWLAHVKRETPVRP